MLTPVLFAGLSMVLRSSRPGHHWALRPPGKITGSVGLGIVDWWSSSPFGTSRPPLSSGYIFQARASWRRLFMQWAPRAFCFALARDGRSMAARMAMMAMTTSNSIRVKAGGAGFFPRAIWGFDLVFILACSMSVGFLPGDRHSGCVTIKICRATSGKPEVVRTIGCLIHKSLAYDRMLLLRRWLSIPLSGGILMV